MGRLFLRKLKGDVPRERKLFCHCCYVSPEPLSGASYCSSVVDAGRAVGRQQEDERLHRLLSLSGTSGTTSLLQSSSSCSKHAWRTEIADLGDVISKDFHGVQGPAFLVSDVVNYFLGPEEERMLLTGQHIVRDVICVRCQTVLGWRYSFAHEESQKYKEGKFILESVKIKQEQQASVLGMGRGAGEGADDGRFATGGGSAAAGGSTSLDHRGGSGSSNNPPWEI
mmetsp:Transcript_10921/g.26779  ORF Transcript_10921/g.26779 Transcript_10921/m.26779 type:complete len:225 (-) Transcript_10921:317-991(-)|eukprot:CAMPEP_0178993022 /NCGR_PEP_ID=MMETSP0795-20121207/6452_1 /TAXON_ID=88552 /ORGANISM="Amoebophrya sp., Strain Ameob2" /LENGTH=224 /DNA_ID=CAMNT_0020684995 /DNA_START=399 /DNA_END=1073 /DNA_ORIENTATION=+